MLTAAKKSPEYKKILENPHIRAYAACVIRDAFNIVTIPPIIINRGQIGEDSSEFCKIVFGFDFLIRVERVWIKTLDQQFTVG